MRVMLMWTCNPPMPLNSASEGASVRMSDRSNVGRSIVSREASKRLLYEKGFIGLEIAHCLSA